MWLIMLQTSWDRQTYFTYRKRGPLDLAWLEKRTQQDRKGLIWWSIFRQLSVKVAVDPTNAWYPVGSGTCISNY